jgi:hypothetical protein
MQFASAASDKTDTAAAVSDVAEQLQTQLGGCTPDLMLFFSNSHMDAGDVGALLAKSAGSGAPLHSGTTDPTSSTPLAAALIRARGMAFVLASVRHGRHPGTVTLGASWTPQPGTGVMGARCSNLTPKPLAPPPVRTRPPARAWSSAPLSPCMHQAMH